MTPDLISLSDFLVPYSSPRGTPIRSGKHMNVPNGHLLAPLPETRTMMLDRKTVSIPRACELVGVSRRTIYNWIAGGKVEYVRTAGGSVRIFVDTLWRDPTNAPQAAGWAERLPHGA